MNKIILPAFTSLTFAGSFIAGKYTNIDLGPLTTTLIRYLIAFVFLVSLIPYHGRKSLRVDRGDLVKLFLIGLFGVVGYHYFFFSSLLYTKAANSAIINAMNPLITGTAAAIFLRERLGWFGYTGVVIAFIGELILLTRGNFQALVHLQFNQGELLMLLGVLCWVVYSLLIKTLMNRYSGFCVTFYAALFGIGQLLVLVWTEPITALTGISGASILALLYMGIGASGVGYLLFNLSIGRIGPTRTASSVYSLLPVFVAILALLFFEEPITLIMAASTLMIVIGLNFALRQPQRKPIP
ncbi:MAG TPA: DMT family transporter [candidate division Zixibacteria bacterium]|nr:DMT family transporter [candidate division Zixibacteria bacterium]